MPTIVRHIKDRTGALNEVVIDRTSKWGNPYRMQYEKDRLIVIALHAKYLATYPSLMKQIQEELADKILLCHCYPKPCHGDVIAAIANREGIYAIL